MLVCYVAGQPTVQSCVLASASKRKLERDEHSFRLKFHKSQHEEPESSEPKPVELEAVREPELAAARLRYEVQQALASERSASRAYDEYLARVLGTDAGAMNLGNVANPGNGTLNLGTGMNLGTGTNFSTGANLGTGDGDRNGKSAQEGEKYGVVDVDSELLEASFATSYPLPRFLGAGAGANTPTRKLRSGEKSDRGDDFSALDPAFLEASFASSYPMPRLSFLRAKSPSFTPSRSPSRKRQLNGDSPCNSRSLTEDMENLNQSIKLQKSANRLFEIQLDLQCLFGESM